MGDDKNLNSNSDSLLVLGKKSPDGNKNVFSTSITRAGAFIPLG